MDFDGFRVFSVFVLIEMEARVEAMWEKMNNGVSNKSDGRWFSNKHCFSSTTVNAVTSHTKANNVRNICSLL